MANFKYSKDINTLSQLSHGHLPSLNKIADRTSENKMTNSSKMKTLLVTGKRLAKRVTERFSKFQAAYAKTQKLHGVKPYNNQNFYQTH